MEYLDKTMIGCLVWFSNTQNEIPNIGILADIYKDPENPDQKIYYSLNGGVYKYCTPAQDSEITFYADKDCITASIRKAKRELIDTIEEIIEDDLEYYKEKYPERYLEVAEEDQAHISCLENDRVVDKTRKLMEEM